MPKVAAAVVTEVFVAGVRSAIVDETADKRRAWDREYQRKRREKQRRVESGGDRVELDPVAAIWSEGVGLLRQLGLTERTARSNIGLWLKTQPPARVLVAIRQAVKARPVDVIPWITVFFGGKNGKGSSAIANAFDDLIAHSEGRTGAGDSDPTRNADLDLCADRG